MELILPDYPTPLGELRFCENSYRVSLTCLSPNMQNTQVNFNFNEYKDYEKRLESFVNWPGSQVVNPEQLAEAGWFYTGQDDRVQCPWCRGRVYNWVRGDTALGEHKRHFPSCPFINKMIEDMLDSSPLLRIMERAPADRPPGKLNWLDLCSVQAVLETGCGRFQVRNALYRFELRGKHILCFFAFELVPVVLYSCIVRRTYDLNAAVNAMVQPEMLTGGR